LKEFPSHINGLTLENLRVMIAGSLSMGERRRGVKRIDWFLLVLMLIGTGIFGLKLWIVYPVKWIGHADAADYAEMADSLIHGRGLSVEYIGYCYFISLRKYPQITHPDAHYPPLYSFLIVPFFLIFGKQAFAAKIPSLLVSSLGLPAVTYLLTRGLTRSRLIGLAAGLAALATPKIFRHSLYCLSDVLFAFMVGATILLFLKALDSPRWFPLAGASAALSYFAKGAGLLLMPSYALTYLLLRGRRVNRRHADRMFVMGMLAALLVLLPWFIRNTIHFGNPIFSTQSYAAGYIGYQNWEVGTYSLYKDGNLPNITWKFKRGLDVVMNKTREFYKRYLWWSFFDEGRGWGDLNWRDFRTYYTGLPALVGFIFFGISALYILEMRALRRLIPPAEVRARASDVSWVLEMLSRLHRGVLRVLNPWFEPRLLAFLIPGGTLMTFLAVCWSPIDRLAFPFVPLVITAGLWTAYRFLSRPVPERFRWIASLILLIGISPLLWHNSNRIYESYKRGGYPYREGGEDWMDVARWLRENAPGAITMTRNPWELHYYTEQKAIQIPREELKDIVDVMRFYKVTHIIPQLNIRPTLKPLVTGEIPGLELVYKNRGLSLYKIRYDLLERRFPSASEP
jgi:4-amino-4-deoxy-L-arabinose transferase-like glycosyltransferase